MLCSLLLTSHGEVKSSGGAGDGILILLTTDFADDTDQAFPIRVIRVIRVFIPGGDVGVGLLKISFRISPARLRI